MVISPDVEAVLGNETHDFPLLYSNEIEQKRLALQLVQDFSIVFESDDTDPRQDERVLVWDDQQVLGPSADVFRGG